MRSFLTLLILTLLTISSTAFAERDWQVVDLGKGVVIRLPTQPTDPEQLAAWNALTPVEQKSFYVKRNFIIRWLARGLTKRGVKAGIRWAKNKVVALKNNLTGKESVAEAAVGENYLDWVSVPEDLSDKSKAFVESTLTSLIDNLWANSTSIAQKNGIGFTFVGGAIWNTTLGNLGYVLGRSLSMDIGVDFKNQEGYLRVLWDKQALKQGGLSFDIGAMADFLLHVTNPELDAGQDFEATHTKLPIVGCFRRGANYTAWGMQFGVGVIDFIGGWVALAGFPILGGHVVAAGRVIGAATVYSTTLERVVLKKKTLSQKAMRLLGFGPLLDMAKAIQPPEVNCAEALSSPEIVEEEEFPSAS